MNMLKVIFTALSLICFVSLMGCEHTVEGVGQDMQQNGQAIQKSMHN